MSGVPRISSSHLKVHKGLIPPLAAFGPVCGPAETETGAPVLRATAISACFISAVVLNRLSGLYSKAVLTTASISGETFELMRRIGRSEKEKGGSRRGS